MPSYFADTWFVIATFDRFDAAHGSIRRLEPRLADRELITHDGVLMEFLAFVSRSGSEHRDKATQVVRNAMRRWTVHPADRPRFLRGVQMYSDRRDKEYSLVDCMSMTIMRDYGIQHVLTNDHHFAQEGFILVNA